MVPNDLRSPVIRSGACGRGGSKRACGQPGTGNGGRQVHSFSLPGTAVVWRGRVRTRRCAARREPASSEVVTVDQNERPWVALTARWLDLDEFASADLVADDVLDGMLAAAGLAGHDVEFGVVDERNQRDGPEPVVGARRRPFVLTEQQPELSQIHESSTLTNRQRWLVFDFDTMPPGHTTTLPSTHG